MADINSRVIAVRSFVPADQYDRAPEWARRAYVDRCCELAKSAKLEQVRRGIGGDGRPLHPRIRPRADHATGKPLDPHYGESRSAKWARATPGYKGGTVTIWWSHGWGRILGFHARGEVIGTYLRNILDYSDAIFARLKAACRHFWSGLRHRFAPHEAPKPTPPAAPAFAPQPRPRPYRVPTAARPGPGAAVDLSRSTLHTGSAEMVTRAAREGTFSGFRRGPGAATSGPFARGVRRGK